MSYFVPTRFVWRFGGRQVHLCGSFTRWVETVPMAPVDGTPGVFAVVVHLPPGYHQYKFIVDGKWRHDETAPFMPDPLGNVNNWLFVRRVDPPSASIANPFDPHPHLVAAQQAAALQQAAATQQQQHQQQQLQQLHPVLAAAPGGPAAAAAAAGLLQSASAAGQPPAGSSSPAGAGASSILCGGGGSAGGPSHTGSLSTVSVANQAAAAAALAVHQQQQVPGGVGGGLHGAGGHSAGHSQPQVQQSQGPQGQGAQQGDVDMGGMEAVVPPIVIHNPKEPEYTRKKISDFLHSHTAYELIPESGKVVVLDVDLPMRQAFHALHEQGTASAPLWDALDRSIPGVISASDFISILRRLRHSISAGGNPLSEAEMDAHTIRGLREAATGEGRPPRPLVYVLPDEDLAEVVARLAGNKCSMAPVLSGQPGGAEPPHVLHLATLSDVLACLMRHFRASLASLPLLAQPLGSLPVGTWSPDAGVAHSEFLPDSKERRQWRKLQPLHTVNLSTPLTTALALLLEAGVSALPVVDEQRCLVDVYARSQITDLCKGGAYNRLQWEDVTVGQGLALSQNSPVPWTSASGGPGAAGPASSNTPSNTSAPTSATIPPPGNPRGAGGGLAAELAAAQQQQQQVAAAGVHHPPGSITCPSGSRVWVVTKDDTLRTVVERLAVPGVRRLVVVHPESRRVEGLISLSDVAQYLFL